jgi:hypothetical protein
VRERACEEVARMGWDGDGNGRRVCVCVCKSSTGGRKRFEKLVKKDKSYEIEKNFCRRLLEKYFSRRKSIIRLVRVRLREAS